MYIMDFPQELIDTLKYNGHSKNKLNTLNDVYSNTLQDAQYSKSAFESAKALSKYVQEYGNYTMEKILTT
jgi:hypothetical protein